MNKQLIGMIHLKALPTAPNNDMKMNQIFEYALQDLNSLEKGGATSAIVENFFDTPYSTNPDFETFIAFTNIFTRLKEKATIPLGVNIHSCSSDKEMTIASLCGADFMRAESFVQARHTQSGMLMPMSANLLRQKKKLNSGVKIFADVNVKESYPFSPQTLEEAINDAIKSYADAIIISGLETGNPPSAEEIKSILPIVNKTPIIVGSGVNINNIQTLIQYSSGVIIGSGLKLNNDVSQRIDVEKVRQISSIINK